MKHIYYSIGMYVRTCTCTCTFLHVLQIISSFSSNDNYFPSLFPTVWLLADHSDDHHWLLGCHSHSALHLCHSNQCHSRRGRSLLYPYRMSIIIIAVVTLMHSFCELECPSLATLGGNTWRVRILGTG